MDSSKKTLESAKALSKATSEALSRADQRAAAARRRFDDARLELERAETDLQRAQDESAAAERRLKKAEEEHSRRLEHSRNTKREEKRDKKTCESRGEAKRAQQAVRDVSPLLFDDGGGRLPFDLPYIGPISISTSVVHGRGLVASRDIEAGECLFITRPVLSANVPQSRECFNRLSRCPTRYEPSYAAEVEGYAEDTLLDELRCLSNILDDEELQTNENLDRARRILGAFRALMSSSDSAPAVSEMDVLLATGDLPFSLDTNEHYIEDEEALGIIRMNAFGPDFHNFDAIARRWTQTWLQEECFYSRMLGVYPLAAMINHSCCPNAIRVFGTVPKSEIGTAVIDEECTGNDVMIVHASTKIPNGEEIVWSYIPPCAPVEQRRHQLKKYGFVCQCNRCVKEMEVEKLIPTLEALDQRALIGGIELALSKSGMPNECQRLLRVGYSTMYIEYFNAALRNMSNQNDRGVSDLLKLATQLHFSFVQCNNACTEHISILHLCYELVSITHMNAKNGHERTKTTNQIRFWTEQLKRAHMVRYGELGQNLELVRKAMKHTQLVLRSDDGFFRVGCKFI